MLWNNISLKHARDPLKNVGNRTLLRFLVGEQDAPAQFPNADLGRYSHH